MAWPVKVSFRIWTWRGCKLPYWQRTFIQNTEKSLYERIQRTLKLQNGHGERKRLKMLPIMATVTRGWFWMKQEDSVAQNYEIALNSRLQPASVFSSQPPFSRLQIGVHGIYWAIQYRQEQLWWSWPTQDHLKQIYQCESVQCWQQFCNGHQLHFLWSVCDRVASCYFKYFHSAAEREGILQGLMKNYNTIFAKPTWGAETCLTWGGHKIHAAPERDTCFLRKDNEGPLCMFEKIGPARFFSTFSAAEMRWPHIIETMKKQQEETVNFSKLDCTTKCDILRSNPVAAIRMFEKSKRAWRPSDELSDFITCSTLWWCGHVLQHGIPGQRVRPCRF